MASLFLINEAIFNKRARLFNKRLFFLLQLTGALLGVGVKPFLIELKRQVYGSRKIEIL